MPLVTKKLLHLNADDSRNHQNEKKTTVTFSSDKIIESFDF